jgi:hypothetical protein
MAELNWRSNNSTNPSLTTALTIKEADVDKTPLSFSLNLFIKLDKTHLLLFQSVISLPDI